MSTTLPTSLSDFALAVDCLEANGSNWVIFQHQFTIAVQQKRVWGQFDGDVQYGALDLKTPKNNKGARAHLQESN